MATFKSEFMRTMQERGFVHQCTNAEALDARLARERVVAYCGFDCTAPSLHAGSLMQIMVMRWLQKTGHKPIILLGGGTSRVGDPSGKDEARKILEPKDIEANLQSIRTVFERYITFGSGPTDAILVNNGDWLDQLNYMVLQAYDFVELNQRYGCALQIGGSDQWGNIIMGIDLNHHIESEKRFSPMSLDKTSKKPLKVLEVQPMIQSKRGDPKDYTPEAFLRYISQGDNKDLFGLTTPLLSTAGGAKMGKTATGAVWLSNDMLTPYDFWQYWRNTEDADVGKFLRLFTELPLKEVDRLAGLKGADINEAKKILASEVTKMCHGDRAARQAAETAKKTFEEGGVGKDIPIFNLTSALLGKGMTAYELLRQAGLATSGSDAKRLIRGGGARINDQKIEDENELIGPTRFGDDATLKLSAGRKKHVLVKLK